MFAFAAVSNRELCEDCFDPRRLVRENLKLSIKDTLN